MAKFIPSPDQHEAIDRIVDWAGEASKEVFLLTGLGGTGKTQVTKAIVAAVPGITLCATTNKAAEVLHERTDLECKTFHSTVYRPKFHHFYGDIVAFAQGDKSKLDADTLKWLKARGKTQNDVPVDEVDYIPNIFYALSIDVMQPYDDGGLFICFEPNTDADYSTLLVDEASMLTQQQVDDAKKVAQRVILVGDFNQLPPVGQEDEEIEYDHKAKLTTRHRTGGTGNNDLDRLADWIMAGKDVRHFEPDPDAGQVFTGNGLPAWAKDHANVPVICFTNKVRHMINAYREANHPANQLKPIIFRTGYSGFLKGTQGVQTSCGAIMANGNILENSDRQRFHMEGDYTKRGAEVAYSYAMTCHSAQGSEWDGVIIDMDSLYTLQFVSKDRKDPELFIRRWLYTAVSRASKAVVLASGIKSSIEREQRNG